MAPGKIIIDWKGVLGFFSVNPFRIQVFYINELTSIQPNNLHVRDHPFDLESIAWTLEISKVWHADQQPRVWELVLNRKPP